MIDIKSLTHDELVQHLSAEQLPKYRVEQIEQWIWEKDATTFDEMTNLPKGLRAQLVDMYSIRKPQLVVKQDSRDGTRKYLFNLDEDTSVETVGIPSLDGKSLTVCFSTQAGCAMQCLFCATGQSGLQRNLSIGEMVDQVRFVGNDFHQRVSHVVAMGQGEPFLNYDAVIAALEIMNSKRGLGVGARHITVSTCGIIPKIQMFQNLPKQYTLAVSLHSAVQETRNYLMPAVQSYPLVDLKPCLKEYGDITKRRPSLEYVLIHNVNDSDSELESLIDFCSGMLAHVNLIPLNPVSGEASGHTTFAPSQRIKYFEHELAISGIEVSVRNSRGADIDGACGQLSQKSRATV